MARISADFAGEGTGMESLVSLYFLDALNHVYAS